MFFFTRSGYNKDIQRLQLMVNDLQEALLKAHESHQNNENRLLDRLQSLLDPATLREHRRGQIEQNSTTNTVPQELSRPKPVHRAFYSPGSKVKNRPRIDWEDHSEQDKADVEKIIEASRG